MNGTGRPEAYFRDDPVGKDYRMNVGASRCAFLEDDNLCFIHRTRGYEAKSSACKAFPIASVEATPTGSFASLAFFCPDEARALLDPEAPAFHSVLPDRPLTAPEVFAAPEGPVAWDRLFGYLGALEGILTDAAITSLPDALLLLAAESELLWRKVRTGRPEGPWERDRLAVRRRGEAWAARIRQACAEEACAMQRTLAAYALGARGRAVAIHLDRICDLYRGTSFMPQREVPAARAFDTPAEWSVGSPFVPAIRRYLLSKLYELKWLRRFGGQVSGMLALALATLTLWWKALGDADVNLTDRFVRSVMATDYLLFGQPNSLLYDPEFAGLLRRPELPALILPA